MGLSCRFQTLPKGSPGRPCDKCKANNKTRATKASGAQRKSNQKYKRSDMGRQVQRKSNQKWKRSDKGFGACWGLIS
jgi:hypothetical protein